MENPTLAPARPAIQMVDLHAQYLRIKPEIEEAIQSVLHSTAFINGPQVKAFAHDLAAYLNVRHVIPCANGTDALQLALMGLAFNPGDEVLLPAFNYVATAETVALLGLTPVFVDVHPDTFCIDVSKAAGLVTSKTVAVMAVHLFGQCADMDAILAFASEHGIKVIEDNAQAIGSVYASKTGDKSFAGALGHVGTTSFFPSKNLGCMGDGGALYTNDDALAERMRMLANHGQRTKYHYELIGVNSRLDTLQAAILQVKLRHLPEFTKARQEAARQYDEALASVEGITIPYRTHASTHVFHQYTIKVSGGRRDALKAHLAKAGIPTMVYYPGALHLQPAFSGLGYQPGSFPISESLAQQVLSLPMHTELSGDMIAHICEAIRSFMQQG